MGIVGQFVLTLLHAQPATVKNRCGSVKRKNDPCGFREHPISMPEMMMASAFLDFGGIPDERFLHEWRIPNRGEYPGDGSSSAS